MISISRNSLASVWFDDEAAAACWLVGLLQTPSELNRVLFAALSKRPDLMRKGQLLPSESRLLDMALAENGWQSVAEELPETTPELFLIDIGD